MIGIEARPPWREATNNADSVRQWLRTCPALDESAWFGADFLKDEPELFALYSTPSPVNARENILGDVEPLPIQRQDFVLACRAPYGQAAQQNMDNLRRFQDIAAWIWAQNAAKRFPDWDGGRITSIAPTVTPEIVEPGSATARYQIRIRVTYHIGDDGLQE